MNSGGIAASRASSAHCHPRPLCCVVGGPARCCGREGEEVRFAYDSPLEGYRFELPVPSQIGNAFTGAAPSSGASRAMRKAAQPCSAASARIGATLPQRQAARIVIRHPFNPAPYPQHHRWLALSNGLAHDQNPAAAVGTRIATSASVRAEKRAVDRRILVDDDWRFVGHVGPPSATCSRWTVAL